MNRMLWRLRYWVDRSSWSFKGKMSGYSKGHSKVRFIQRWKGHVLGSNSYSGSSHHFYPSWLGFSFLSCRLLSDDRLELLYEERLLSEDSDLFLLCFFTFLVFLLFLHLRKKLPSRSFAVRRRWGRWRGWAVWSSSSVNKMICYLLRLSLYSGQSFCLDINEKCTSDQVGGNICIRHLAEVLSFFVACLRPQLSTCYLESFLHPFPWLLYQLPICFCKPKWLYPYNKSIISYFPYFYDIPKFAETILQIPLSAAVSESLHVYLWITHALLFFKCIIFTNFFN